MQMMSGFPYAEVQYTKTGSIHDRGEVDALLDLLRTQAVTDLLVMAHGWNNDMDDARNLYRSFFARLRVVLDGNPAAGGDARRFAILGVLWPSKKFAEKDLIPSGAAGVAGAVTDAVLLEQLDDLSGTFTDPAADGKLEQAKTLVPRLDNSPEARKDFADLMRSVLPAAAADEEDASTNLFSLSGEQVMQRLSKPVLPTLPTARPGAGGAARVGVPRPPAGGAAGIGQFFSGMKSAARNLLNFATYYQMKERGGTVGTEGLYPVLREIRAQHSGIRLHLIGHSFGGRLVTAAAAGPKNEPAVKANSLTLLQAAYSHYGLAKDYEGTKDGLFRRVLADGIVTGPVIITHTQNDKAVGIAYPLASLIAGQVAAALGDKNDRYGGMGRNGAQKTPEASDGTLLKVGEKYDFAPGKVYNLSADETIKNHSDICKDAVAHALLSAVAAG